MTMTEAQRRAKNKYDKANYTNLTTKIKREEADEIRERFKQYNETPSAIMREALNKWMDTHPNKDTQ